MRTRHALVVFGVALWTYAPPASAGPILPDIVYQPSLNAGWTVAGSNQFAQTWTVGLSGLLAGIDLSIGRESNPLATGNVYVAILPTDSGTPVSDLSKALASVTLPATHWVTRDTVVDSESYRHVELPIPFAVSTGDVLAIYVAHGAGIEGDRLYWYGNGNDDGSDLRYASGVAYERVGSASPWAPISGGDLAFVTYVETPAAIPEPASLLLFGTGLVGLRAWRKRRQ